MGGGGGGGRIDGIGAVTKQCPGTNSSTGREKKEKNFNGYPDHHDETHGRAMVLRNAFLLFA